MSSTAVEHEEQWWRFCNIWDEAWWSYVGAAQSFWGFWWVS